MGAHVHIALFYHYTRHILQFIESSDNVKYLMEQCDVNASKFHWGIFRVDVRQNVFRDGVM
jgi:hypothetical protein